MKKTIHYCFIVASVILSINLCLGQSTKTPISTKAKTRLFPYKSARKVVIFSFDTLTKDSEKLMSESLHVLIDTLGRPLHTYYHQVTLSKGQRKKLAKLLQPVPADQIDNYGLACISVYRDAIVFYDRSEKVIGYIEICFECHKFSFRPEINYDPYLSQFVGYPALVQLFKEVGLKPIRH